VSRNDAALGAGYEREKLLNECGFCTLFGGRCDPFRKDTGAAEQNTKCAPETGNLVRRDASPLQADEIQGNKTGAVALHDAEWRDVLRDHRASGDEGELADANELVDGAQAAEDSPITDFDMPSQSRRIRQPNPVANVAIVRDMRTRHEKVVVSDNRLAASRRCARLQGRVFTDYVPVADPQQGRFSFVLQVLGCCSDRSELVDLVRVSNDRIPLYDDVGADTVLVADPNPGAYDRIGTDRRIFTNCRIFRNDCRGMNEYRAHLCGVEHDNTSFLVAFIRVKVINNLHCAKSQNMTKYYVIIREDLAVTIATK
jgi:hypothetical protein